MSLLLDDPSTPGLGPPDVSTCQQAFTAILGEERPSLTHVRDLIDRLQQQVDNLT